MSHQSGCTRASFRHLPSASSLLLAGVQTKNKRTQTQSESTVPQHLPRQEALDIVKKALADAHSQQQEASAEASLVGDSYAFH